MFLEQRDESLGQITHAVAVAEVDVCTCPDIRSVQNTFAALVAGAVPIAKRGHRR